MSLTHFRNFKEATAKDWAIINHECDVYERGLVDRVLAAFEKLKGSELGMPIDRYDHSLQTATRAYRDGADEETIVCALLHDVGDDLAPYAHGELAAAILKPYVSEQNAWVLAHHGIFQGYYYFHFSGGNRDARERFRDHPYFEACAHFCEAWDQASFDQTYESLPLEFFEPMVRRLFARKPFDGKAETC